MRQLHTVPPPHPPSIGAGTPFQVDGGRQAVCQPARTACRAIETTFFLVSPRIGCAVHVKTIRVIVTVAIFLAPRAARASLRICHSRSPAGCLILENTEDSQSPALFDASLNQLPVESVRVGPSG